jgi:hypothetical protein
MAIIELSRGKVAIVDDEDYERIIAGPKWSCDSKGYAVRHVYDADGHRHMEKMHRVVMRAAPSEHVDHRFHNTLDNRKSVLRKSNCKLNGANRLKQKTQAGTTPKSKFKGVWYDPKRNRWRATIKVNGKTLFIGRHPTEEEAARAYDKKALEYWGEYASLNFSFNR